MIKEININNTINIVGGTDKFNAKEYTFSKHDFWGRNDKKWNKMINQLKNNSVNNDEFKKILEARIKDNGGKGITCDIDTKGIVHIKQDNKEIKHMSRKKAENHIAKRMNGDMIDDKFGRDLAITGITLASMGTLFLAYKGINSYIK